MLKKTKGIFKKVYHQLIEINDTPQRVALGFALGIFLGVLPGTGPIASIVLAKILKLNIASSLIASILSNTWLSIILFFLAARVAGCIMKIDPSSVVSALQQLLTNFHWRMLFRVSFGKFIIPVAIGYLVVSIIAAIIGYVFTLSAIFIFKQRRGKCKG